MGLRCIIEADARALAIGAGHRAYYRYDLPREAAASKRIFKISARYGVALSQVAWDRLPNGYVVKTAHLLMRLSTEDSGT